MEHLDVRYGFRDAVFESDVSSFAGLILLKRFGDTSYYERPSDDLTLGNARLSFIHYVFHKRKLSSIEIGVRSGSFDGRYNWQEVFEVLQKAWGEPAHNDGNLARWNGKRASGAFAMDFESGDTFGKITIWSHSAAHEMAADVERTNKMAASGFTQDGFRHAVFGIFPGGLINQNVTRAENDQECSLGGLVMIRNVGNTQWYKRRGEHLDMGTARVEQILYGFYKHKLYSIELMAQGRENSKTLFDILGRAYTRKHIVQAAFPDTVWHPFQQIIWRMPHVRVAYYAEGTSNVRVVISSQKILAEINADEKAEAKKRAGEAAREF